MLRLKNVAPKTIGLEVTADVMKAMEDWLPFSLPPVWKTLIVPSWAVLPVAAMLIVGGIIGAVKGEESVGAAMVAIGLSVAAAAAINLVVSYRQRNKQKLRLQAGNQPDPFERHLTGG